MTQTALRQFGDELTASYRLTLQRFVTLQLRGSEQAPRVLAQLRGEFLARDEPSPEALRAALGLLERIDLRNRLRAVRQRTVVVAGERDAHTPPGAGWWLSQNLPHASFRLIAGAAHVPFLSHPDAFLAALAELANELPDGA